MTNLMMAGSRIHFRVLDESRGWGMTWRLQTKSTSNDLYLSSIEGRRWGHGSLHASGQVHEALTKRALKQAPQGTPRHFGIKPAAHMAGLGVEHFAHIIVEAESLSIDWHETATPVDVIDVAPIPGSRGVGFDIFRVLGSHEPTFTDARLVVGSNLGGGGRVVVIAFPLLTEGAMDEVIANDLTTIQAQLDAARLTPPIRLSYEMQDELRPALKIYADVVIR